MFPETLFELFCMVMGVGSMILAVCFCTWHVIFWDYPRRQRDIQLHEQFKVLRDSKPAIALLQQYRKLFGPDGESVVEADLELMNHLRSDLQTEALSILQRMARSRRHRRGSSGSSVDTARISEIVELSGLEPHHAATLINHAMPQYYSHY